MIRTLFRGASVCAAIIGIWQASAYAECPDTALQSTADNFIAVSQPGADVSGVLAAVDGLIAACPTSPHVLKLAAMTYANSPAPDASISVDRLTTSLSLISRMWENLDGHPTKFVIDQNGKRQSVNFTNLYDIEKNILNRLFQAEQVSGIQSSYTQPPAEGDANTGCGTMDRTSVSIASLWIQRQGDHPGAYSLMDNRIAKCEAELADRRNTGMLGNRARAMLASIQRDPRQPGALEKAARAKADSERFLALFGDYELAAWSESDALALKDATNIVRGSHPAVLSKALFTLPQRQDPAAQLSLALLLDEAWAKDAETGLATGYKTYRDVLRTAYDITQSLDDPAPARTMLYNAAEAQASGKVRAPHHESLAPPPAFLYRWINPSNFK